MLILIITPRRGFYPSLACFDKDRICYDYRGRRDALNALNKQVVCFNWGVIDKVKIQATQYFISRRDVKQVLAKLRFTPVEIKQICLDANGVPSVIDRCQEKQDPVNDLLTQFGSDVHPADVSEAIRESRKSRVTD